MSYLTDKRSKQNKSWRAVVIEDFECEGLDNQINHYDDYDWVGDPKFKELLDKYKEARRAIINYTGYKNEM